MKIASSQLIRDNDSKRLKDQRQKELVRLASPSLYSRLIEIRRSGIPSFFNTDNLKTTTNKTNYTSVISVPHFVASVFNSCIQTSVSTDRNTRLEHRGHEVRSEEHTSELQSRF